MSPGKGTAFAVRGGTRGVILRCSKDAGVARRKQAIVLGSRIPRLRVWVC